MRMSLLTLTGLLCMLAACSSNINPAPVTEMPVTPESHTKQVNKTPHPTKAKKASPPLTAPEVSETTPLDKELTTIHWSWPVDQHLTAVYHHERKGLDIEVKESSTIHASATGVVSYVGDSLKGYGHMVVIKHTPDVLSVYADNQEILVKEGQQVKAGDAIAKLIPKDPGSHAILHFEIRFKGKPVNPQRLLITQQP